jgi:deoxyribodipyrimidine photo-lyase
MPPRSKACAVTAASAPRLVWFKRDLRIDDHRPLAEAAARGPVLPVYVVEPGYWRRPDASARQQAFVAEALVELDAALGALGQGLWIEVGELPDAFERLRRRFGFSAIHAHEETGNDWTFRRDRRVRAWCRASGIELFEHPQFGVVRSLADRGGWAARWERYMGAERIAPPDRLEPVVGTAACGDPFADAPAYDATPAPGRQRGGLKTAAGVLEDFLARRGSAYRGGISSPLTAASACSRLSAHFAWGTLSLRTAVQAARARRRAAREAGQSDWAKSLAQFDRRLHWHCHFIQKLEQRPDIEFDNVHRGFDGMREGDFDAARFAAWSEGRTGFPLVDACMRWLSHDGWLNFRMRALLMSFAGYHLWLHWREPALHLARLFTDYEPGIHYSQCQMQTGTTGINTLRIYNPVKQARDQDPDGAFVRRWVPELAHVPSAAIFEPWKLGSRALERYGAGDYPRPVVDHVVAARRARQRIGEFRARAGFADQADRIQRELGSRRAGLNTPRRPKRVRDSAQRSLF